MRFFTLIIHTLPASALAGAVEWCVCALCVHTQGPVSMSVCVCVCLTTKLGAARGCLRAAAHTHRSCFSLNQCLDQTLLPIAKAHI